MKCKILEIRQEEEEVVYLSRPHGVYYKLDSLFGLFEERRRRSPPPPVLIIKRLEAIY